MAIDIKAYKLIDKGIYQHSKDKTSWMLSVSVNGKQKRKTFILSKDTPTNMKQQAIIFKGEFVKSARGIADDNSTIQTLFDDWVKYKDSNWSEGNRVKMVTTFGKHIKPSIAKKKIKDVRPLDITKILSVDASKRVKKSITEILFPMFNFAITNKMLSQTPMTADHYIKRDTSKEKKKVTDAPVKYKAVYKAIMSLPTSYQRAYMLLGFHGRRKTEALTLRWEDISKDMTTYVIRAERNKVDEDMTYTMPEDVKAELLLMKEEYNPTNYIFESPKRAGQPIADIREVVATVRTSCGLKEFGYHWMRNLCVSALYQSDKASLGDLSAMLGHTDFNTLKKYLTGDREKSTQRTTQASMELLR